MVWIICRSTSIRNLLFLASLGVRLKRITDVCCCCSILWFPNCIGVCYVFQAWTRYFWSTPPHKEDNVCCYWNSLNLNYTRVFIGNTLVVLEHCHMHDTIIFPVWLRYYFDIVDRGVQDCVLLWRENPLWVHAIVDHSQGTYMENIVFNIKILNISSYNTGSIIFSKQPIYY